MMRVFTMFRRAAGQVSFVKPSTQALVEQAKTASERAEIFDKMGYPAPFGDREYEQALLNRELPVDDRIAAGRSLLARVNARAADPRAPHTTHTHSGQAQGIQVILDGLTKNTRTP